MSFTWNAPYTEIEFLLLQGDGTGRFWPSGTTHFATCLSHRVYVICILQMLCFITSINLYYKDFRMVNADYQGGNKILFYQDGTPWTRISIKHWENYASRWWNFWSFHGNWHCNSLLALCEHDL